MKVKSLILDLAPSPEFPLTRFPLAQNHTCPKFIFLDITVLREKLKKEQMERERYENEANHQSRKVKIF